MDVITFQQLVGGMVEAALWGFGCGLVWRVLVRLSLSWGS